MKLVIETHSFAPELNTIHFVNKKGEFIGSHSAPGITSIKQARKNYFAPVKPGKAAFITATYENPDHTWLNSERSGRFTTYPELKAFVNQLAAKKKGGPLLDGSYLPDAKITVKTRLIG